MVQTYLESSSIIASLGWNTREVLGNVLAGKGGILLSEAVHLSDTRLPVSLIDPGEMDLRFEEMADPKLYTRFEQAAILSVKEALADSRVDPSDPATIMILSTTKGNVALLEDPGRFGKDRLMLWRPAGIIADFFKMKARPIIISNACISGLAAMLLARRLIGGGTCQHVIVSGVDLLSRFIVSGFQSFLSLSAEPCRPFDAGRDGLTLGEAAATVVLSGQHGEIELVRGAVTNDANHISGPSRTGEGLLLAIRNTLDGAKEVDLVSAHGTATVYNDEMESLALARAGLGHVPVNSLKGYLGHTLGAAGVVESVLNAEAMKQNRIPGTLGFSNPGVSGKIDVVKRVREVPVRTMLKTASGFGGCNAAALFRKRL